MNFYKQTKTESKPVVQNNFKIDSQYRLIELYIKLYQKHKLEGVPFDVLQLIDSSSYKTYKEEYNKRVKNNMCSFLVNDEHKILSDILVDLDEIFTSFIRDDSVMKKQEAFYDMQKEKELVVLPTKCTKEKNLLFLLELFSKYRLKKISIDKLLKASENLHCTSSLESSNGHASVLIKHDKAAILNDLVVLLEEQIFGQKDLLRKGGVK
jgi:hypothetical protein